MTSNQKEITKMLQNGIEITTTKGLEPDFKLYDGICNSMAASLKIWADNHNGKLMLDIPYKTRNFPLNKVILKLAEYIGMGGTNTILPWWKPWMGILHTFHRIPDSFKSGDITEDAAPLIDIAATAIEYHHADWGIFNEIVEEYWS